MPMRVLSLLFAVAASGALVACEAPPKMHGPTMARVGDDVVVTFEAPLQARASSLYWVALQPADSPTSSTEGRLILESGERRKVLRAATPGNYEIRLHERYPKSDHRLIARTPVTILHRADLQGPVVD